MKQYQLQVVIKVACTSDTSRTSPFYGGSVNDTTPVQVRTSENISIYDIIQYKQHGE
jgi:hypothetical protein